MMFLFGAILTAMLISPLYLIYKRHISHKPVKSTLLIQIIAFFGMGIIFVGTGMNLTMAAETASSSNALSGLSDMGISMIAAALSTGLSGIGGGIAVASAASAALGAISENEKAFGKSLIFVGLAEGIALYGMIISFMIILRFQ